MPSGSSLGGYVVGIDVGRLGRCTSSVVVPCGILAEKVVGIGGNWEDILLDMIVRSSHESVVSVVVGVCIRNDCTFQLVELVWPLSRLESAFPRLDLLELV